MGFVRDRYACLVRSLGYCEDSDITDDTFVKMRGANTRTAGHRVFLFYCEERHKNLCLVCRQNNDLHLACRDRRPRRSNVASVTNCISVCYQNKGNIRKQYIYLLFKDRRGRRSLQLRENILSKSWLSPLSFSMSRGYYDCKMHFRLLSKQ